MRLIRKERETERDLTETARLARAGHAHAECCPDSSKFRWGMRGREGGQNRCLAGEQKEAGHLNLAGFARMLRLSVIRT